MCPAHASGADYQAPEDATVQQEHSDAVPEESEEYFSLIGEDEAEFIEGVETFKYLVRILDQ